MSNSKKAARAVAISTVWLLGFGVGYLAAIEEITHLWMIFPVIFVVILVSGVITLVVEALD